jgi:hypothetical protein
LDTLSASWSGVPPPWVHPAPYSAARPLQLVELALESRAALREVDAARLVVVRAAADREAEREAPAGQAVDGRARLCQQRRVGAQRRDQDVGDESDPIGHGGRRRERQQRLVARVDDPGECPERGEAGVLRAARPLQDAAPVHAAHGVWQPDADLHESSSLPVERG